ncbi:aspartate-semialdehyde dehydrogenase [Rickettsiaceae bacterium]|nr:aspartate-semialdehyde dehydrogenase [Rickettsiaceae bacterium]
MNKEYVVAVIGATGNVGRQVLTYLEDRNFPVKEMIAVASSNSVGKMVSFKDRDIKVFQIKEIDFADIDIAFFCAGSSVSERYAKKAADQGCIVIDKSSFYRLDKDIPLVVPEVNVNSIKNFKKGIISNPNCCTIPLVTALKPLDNAAKIKRLVISTYQSVSGAGKDAMDELYSQTKAKFVFQQPEPKILPNQIAFNLFPHIGDFRKDGYTEEEYKIERELKKIIGDHISSTVTCVRLPVFVSHSMSVNVEFENHIDASEAEELLYEADGITVHNMENEMKYVTPVEAVENDDVYVSRIRDDMTRKNCINMWICTDNLRKGAALNAVQIAEELV